MLKTKPGLDHPQLAFHPWWWEAASPNQPHSQSQEKLSLPATVDVVIIGAGFTGLSAALTLCRAGHQVFVLDEFAPGFGASTRNGGLVGSGNQKFTVSQLVKRYGEQKTRDLVNEGSAMLQYLAGLVEREKIDCHFTIAGRLRVATKSAHYPALELEMEELHDFTGTEFYMVPKSELQEEIGSDYYHGGVVLPDDATIHPALYHRGLMQRVLASGGTIIGFTPVNSVSTTNGKIRITTCEQHIDANECIIATNAYTPRGLLHYYKRIIPIGSAIIATEELPQEIIDGLIPNRRGIVESGRVYHYYRISPDGKRLIFGGRTASGNTDEAKTYRHLHEHMLRVFPQLQSTSISHCWSGYVGYTTDTLPHLGKQDGVHYAMGYCGTGVARSTYFGHKIALQLLNDAQGETAFDDIDFKPFPLGAGLTRAAVPLAVQCQRGMDCVN